MTEAKIGKLSLDNQHQEKATLHCYCPQSCVLTIDLLDSLGRTFIHQQFSLQKGDNDVPLNIGHLPPGEYNAWASIGTQTAIRPLSVKPRKKLQGLLERWFLW
ncbi:MAG: hypothetical protein KDD19_22170 [Phaeodactylibacter sp.]|nr:hypothetical protein [Phaeodactylibacter sp.]MCB9053285.1 hypothetical protein [Lewinellaceae bacterium]